MQFVINKWKVIQGQDEQLCVFLIDSDGAPVSISGASAVHAVFLNQDGSKLEKVAFSGWSCGISAPLWVYGFQLTAIETAALLLGTSGVEIKVLFGTLQRWLNFPNSLIVVALPF